MPDDGRHPFTGPRYQTFAQAFDLTGRVAIVTGGAGFLGPRHAEALMEAGAIPIVNDVDQARIDRVLGDLATRFPGKPALGVRADITRPDDVERMVAETVAAFGRLDILINNAANNPKMSGGEDAAASRLESFPLERWDSDLAVGLTGAFLCCQVAGRVMAERGRGVIVNVSSDMGIISPDQRVYLRPGQKEGEQAYKPITYAVVKGALVSMTRWLATYYAPRGLRVNTLTPASVWDGQPEHLVDNLSQRIPLGRMSHHDEFKGALLFLCSDASSYMTGHNLILDGGRSIW